MLLQIKVGESEEPSPSAAEAFAPNWHCTVSYFINRTLFIKCGVHEKTEEDEDPERRKGKVAGSNSEGSDAGSLVEPGSCACGRSAVLTSSTAIATSAQQ